MATPEAAKVAMDVVNGERVNAKDPAACWEVAQELVMVTEGRGWAGWLSAG